MCTSMEKGAQPASEQPTTSLVDGRTPQASNLRGIALIVAAMQIVPINDMMIKVLDTRYPPQQQVWARQTAQLLFMLPIALFLHGPAALLQSGRQPILHLRGLLSLSASGCFYFALKYMPLVDLAGILQCAPLVIALLSPVLLKERGTPRRLIAAVLGFCSVLLIIRPGFTEFHPASLAGPVRTSSPCEPCLSMCDGHDQCVGVVSASASAVSHV